MSHMRPRDMLTQEAGTNDLQTENCGEGAELTLDPQRWVWGALPNTGRGIQAVHSDQLEIEVKLPRAAMWGMLQHMLFVDDVLGRRNRDVFDFIGSDLTLYVLGFMRRWRRTARPSAS